MLLVLLLGFFGLAYSIFPFIMVDQLTICQSASSPATLEIILAGDAVAIPSSASIRCSPTGSLVARQPS